jgi:general secretion pathway protein G
MQASVLRKRSRGFTLLELIVVITIIGLLGTMVVVKVGGVLFKANKTKVQADLRAIVKGAETFHALSGYYPETIEELVSGRDQNGEAVGTELELNKDPWGNDYVYELIDGKPHAMCYGRDGQIGGENDDQDYEYPESADAGF